MNGDILFSGLTCDEIILNSSYKSVVKYGNDTLLNFAVSNYNENLLYGKYSLNNSLIAQPQIITPSNPVFCSNSDDITLTVPPLSSASTYHWQLFPANAGQIISNGNSILLNVDSNFAGQIKIVCYASNFCNVSTLSDTLTLTINQAPIIYSIDDTGFGAVTSNVVNATNFNWYLDNVLLNFANMPTVNCIADGIYSIIATNGTCDDTLASFVSCIVSDVDEISTTGVNIYPNPAQENITIEIDPSETIKAITIYDVSGKLLIQSTAVTNKIILNISELSFGYYFVKVQSSLSHYVSKIMID
jgi:hypothetical protein